MEEVNVVARAEGMNGAAMHQMLGSGGRGCVDRSGIGLTVVDGTSNAVLSPSTAMVDEEEGFDLFGELMS